MLQAIWFFNLIIICSGSQECWWHTCIGILFNMFNWWSIRYHKSIGHYAATNVIAWKSLAWPKWRSEIAEMILKKRMNHVILSTIVFWIMHFNKMEDTAMPNCGLCYCISHSIQWRHNERHGVSNHQHLDCLQIKSHQSSASLAFVRGIHRWPVNSAHKGPITRQMFPLDDVIKCHSRPYKCFN